MLVLKATTEQIQVVLAGAITTSQLDCFACFRDIAAATYAAGSNATATNGVTDVNLVPAPAPLTQRVIDYLSVYNNDTAPATVTIKQDNGGVERILWRGALGASEGLTYTDGTGWSKLNTGGVPVAGGSGGNPTALVGTVAINGVASTFLRSDGAPAINQAMTPTWTGMHAFRGTIVHQIVDSQVSIGNLNPATTYPAIVWTAKGPIANGRIWRQYVDETSGAWALQTLADDGATAKYALEIVRNANVITGINYGNAVDNPLHTFSGNIIGQGGTWTGTHTFKGAANLDVAANGVSIGLRANFPVIELLDTVSAVDTRRWEWIAPGSGNLHMTMQNDANTAGNDWMKVNRTGINVTGIEYGNSTNNPTHRMYGKLTADGFETTIAGVAYGMYGGSYGWGVDAGFMKFYNRNSGTYYFASSTDAVTVSIQNDGAFTCTAVVAGIPTGYLLGAGTINAQGGVFENGIALGYKDMPSRQFSAANDAITNSDRGRCAVYVGGGGGFLQLNTGVSVGATTTIINAGPGILSIGAPGGLYWYSGAGSPVSGIHYLASGGVCTVWTSDGNAWNIWGVGITRA